MYLDEIEKLNYYKKRIINELAKKGVYPDDAIVTTRLNELDSKLALFQNTYINEGDYFDAAKFNNDLQLIYEDLKILYKLTVDIAIEKLNVTKEYVATHIKELKALADRYQQKTKLELENTSLGDTVYFKTSGFNIEIGNCIATVRLEDFKVTKGATLSFLFNGDNINSQNVVLGFGLYRCSPYSYNRDTIRVTSKINCKTYDYEPPAEETVNSARMMNIDNFMPDYNNKYIIYAGNNQISTRYNVMDFSIGNSYSFNHAEVISFYVIDSTYINFNYSTKPNETNFSGTSINSPDKHQKILIDFPANFNFSMETDGKIYAARANGYIKDKQLYYPDVEAYTDYYIEEYFINEKETIKNATVTIYNLKEDIPLKIDMIAIKETINIEESVQ